MDYWGGTKGYVPPPPQKKKLLGGGGGGGAGPPVPTPMFIKIVNSLNMQSCYGTLGINALFKYSPSGYIT